jgi:predicted transposase YdaD
MKTDVLFHQIFKLHPEWIYDLLGEPCPGPCTFESITVKQLERRLDGLVQPIDERQAQVVVEFQFYPDPLIYIRTTEELCAVQRQAPERPIDGVIFFGERSLDPRTAPWTRSIRSVYLIELWRQWQSEPAPHPLLSLFAPIFEEDEMQLEAEAAVLYESVGSAATSPEDRRKLQDLFFSLLGSRLTHKTRTEIAKMLPIRDLKETVWGKELYDEGLNAGEARGEARGEVKGKATTLAHIAQKRFGKLAPAALDSIHCLDFIQLEGLEEVLLDLKDASALNAWLDERK